MAKLYWKLTGMVWIMPYTTATSIKTAGILPIVLATMNKGPEIGVKEAPAVTNPDGTKGIRRSKMIVQNTWLVEDF